MQLEIKRNRNLKWQNINDPQKVISHAELVDLSIASEKSLRQLMKEYKMYHEPIQRYVAVNYSFS